MTPDQIGAFALPTFSAETKSRDARYHWFHDHHGTVCCELDALDPNLLRQTVEDAIVARIDWVRWGRAEVVEHAELQSLGDFLASYKGAAR